MTCSDQSGEWHDELASGLISHIYMRTGMYQKIRMGAGLGAIQIDMPSQMNVLKRTTKDLHDGRMEVNLARTARFPCPFARLFRPTLYLNLSSGMEAVSFLSASSLVIRS